MLALMKIVDGEKVFVSASNPHEVTDDFDKALEGVKFSVSMGKNLL